MEHDTKKLIESELNQVARKNHDLAIKLVAVLNLLFFISDYFNVPEKWVLFLIIRIIITAIFFSFYLVQDKFNFHSLTVAYIAYLGCIVENSIFFNSIGAEALQKFTLAFIATFIGAAMMAVWKIKYSVLAVLGTLILNAVLFIFFSPLKLSDYLANGAFLTLMVAIFSVILIHTRYALTYKEISARIKLKVANEKIFDQNKNITDSIMYAQRIQSAVLPSKNILDRIFPHNFVLFKPRDIVSGDFYWFSSINEYKIVVAADCTGHGVPGAFMSMLGVTLLNEIVNNRQVISANKILDALREQIILSISQTGNTVEQKDGMDISLCIINNENLNLQFAGAYNSLYIIKKPNDTDAPQLQQIKADKMPIGVHPKDKEPFTNHQIQLEKNDRLYLFSDGYVSQFGGAKAEKFKSKRFQDLLLNIQDRDIKNQKEILELTLNNWQGKQQQVDDILVIGFQI